MGNRIRSMGCIDSVNKTMKVDSKPIGTLDKNLFNSPES